MKHTFSVQFNMSLKFSDKLADIGDAIMGEKTTRNIFGYNPVISPEKTAFSLTKNENQLVIFIAPIFINNSQRPVNNIILSLTHKSDNFVIPSDFNVSFLECINIFKTTLNIGIEKIGSVYTDLVLKENSISYLQKYVTPFLNNITFPFNGGNFRFLYKKALKSIGVNIGITFQTEQNDSFSYLIDINSDKNQPENIIDKNEIQEILDFSNTFTKNYIDFL
ncbi:hypothetical protein [Pectinatus frisingensis]|uniref:hypothetical protein n=1 Tax=Pectinatus frisingensis TaxID=865 RepID=UPI0018C5648A|nr:hypothetical protein [Pectinatus frisingensis]